MITDLLATDNMVSYNVKNANVMGLHTAIYLTELINISVKATVKKKLVVDKYFTVDRKYVTKRTTLDVKEQLAIDNKLAKVGIIQKPAGGIDTLYIDIDKLSEMMSSDDTAYLQKVSNNTQVKTAAIPGLKQTMRQRECEEMKSYLTTVNSDIRSALEGWVDGVYKNPNGFLSKRAVGIFERTVDEYAKGDFNIAMKLIDIATVGGYRDAKWAINTYEDEVKKNGSNRNSYVNTSTRRQVVLADEVY
jgi:hypothetical protein